MKNLTKKLNIELNSFKKEFVEVISSPHPKFILIAITVFILSFIYGLSMDKDIVKAYSNFKNRLLNEDELPERNVIPSKARIVDTPNTANTATPTTRSIVYYPTATPDPDPIIACNVSINCGGGTRSLRKSICEQSTCCEVGNSWTFYEDKNKCKQDQDTYWSVYYNNKFDLSQYEYNPNENKPKSDSNNNWIPEYNPIPTSDYDRSIYVEQCYKNAVATIDGDCRREAEQSQHLGIQEPSAYCSTLKNQRYEQAKADCERAVQ